MTNVIDFTTGRPVGAPALFVPHYWTVDDIRRAPHPTDIVGFTAIVKRNAADRLITVVGAQMHKSAAARPSVVTLTRISHQKRCIGPENMRNLFCNKELSDSESGSDANTLYL